MTLKEMIYDIWEEVRRNIVDDDAIDERLIKNAINYHRARWVENYINKEDAPSRYEQKLGRYELEIKPSSFDYTTETGKVVLVTTNTIPTPIYIKGTPLISVSPNDIFSGQFRYIDETISWALGHGKFSAPKKHFAYIDNKIVILGAEFNELPTLEYIYINIVAEDPTEAPGFSDETSDYPINGKIWSYLRKDIVASLISKTGAINDTINNSKDDTLQEGVVQE